MRGVRAGMPVRPVIRAMVRIRLPGDFISTGELRNRSMPNLPRVESEGRSMRPETTGSARLLEHLHATPGGKGG